MSGVNTKLSEVAIVLASGDDTDEFEKAAETCYKASEYERIKIVETKKCLEALAKMKDKETNLNELRVEESKKNKETVLGLESKERDTAVNIESLNDKVESVEEAVKQVNISASKANETKAAILQENVEVLPKIKYAFSLYSNITRIRWDYDSDEDQLKGFVASLRDVRPFKLNNRENSKYFTANYLWDVAASC